MSVLSLVIAPDPRLNEPSEAVVAVDDDIRKLCSDMLDTMYAHQGIGLAAVQVGVMKRVVVVDVEWGSSRYEREDDARKDGRPIRMINPEIVAESKDLSTYNEGCLSFPDHHSDVTRPAEVVVRFLDETGREQTIKATGLLATCIQHEIDHINGTVFVDHISKLKRDMIIRKLRKAKKLGTLPDVHDPQHKEM